MGNIIRTMDFSSVSLQSLPYTKLTQTWTHYRTQTSESDCKQKRENPTHILWKTNVLNAHQSERNAKTQLNRIFSFAKSLAINSKWNRKCASRHEEVLLSKRALLPKFAKKRKATAAPEAATAVKQTSERNNTDRQTDTHTERER